MAEARRVEAGRGWAWIVEGWQLFKKAPGLWIAMLLIYAVVGMLLSFIPLIGAMAYTLVMPSLMGGMIYGAAMLNRGERLEIAHLFRAFQDQDRLGPMLVLGALLLAAYIVMALVLGGIVAGWMMGSDVTTPMPEERAIGMVTGFGSVVGLLVLLISIIIAMALFYAVPLVMLGKKAPWPAVQKSLSACLINIPALLVFGVIYILLAIIATIPFGLGFLILGPVTFSAVFASYRDVFADSRASEGGTAPSLRK